MCDIAITKESISGRMQNVVKVGISLEGDWKEGEYQVSIEGFIGSLKIDAPGGEDDPYLIKAAIEEDAENIFADKEEAYIEVFLVESGEWQDVFWCKWYDVAKVVRHDLI